MNFGIENCVHNLKGSLLAVVFFAWPVGLSDAPDGLLSSLETAVVWPGGTGVLEPDGVLVLHREIS